jgi:hypothetical protein
VKAQNISSLGLVVVLATLGAWGCSGRDEKTLSETEEIKRSLTQYHPSFEELQKSLATHSSRVNLTAMYSQLRSAATDGTRTQIPVVHQQLDTGDLKKFKQYLNLRKDQLEIAEAVSKYPDDSILCIIQAPNIGTGQEAYQVKIASHLLVLKALVTASEKGRVAGLKALLPALAPIKHASDAPFPVMGGIAQDAEERVCFAIQCMLEGGVPLTETERGLIKKISDSLPKPQTPAQFIVASAVEIDSYASSPANLEQLFMSTPEMQTAPGRNGINEIWRGFSGVSSDRIRNSLWKDVKAMVQILDDPNLTHLQRTEQFRNLSNKITASKDSAQLATRCLLSGFYSIDNYLVRLAWRDLLKLLTLPRLDLAKLPTDVYSSGPYKVVDNNGLRTILSEGPAAPGTPPRFETAVRERPIGFGFRFAYVAEGESKSSARRQRRN